METTLICSGFGGQGVMVAGQILCYTALEISDKFVTFYPSYGIEMRGGTANCYVVISDEAIGAPMVNHVNNLMVFNNPSLVRFESYLDPGGNLFINSTVVDSPVTRDDINVISVDASTIAVELGSTRCMNLVMVGAFIGYTDTLPEYNCLETIFKQLGEKRPEMNPINEAAFKRGLEIGRAAKKE